MPGEGVHVTHDITAQPWLGRLRAYTPASHIPRSHRSTSLSPFHRSTTGSLRLRKTGSNNYRRLSIRCYTRYSMMVQDQEASREAVIPIAGLKPKPLRYKVKIVPLLLAAILCYFCIYGESSTMKLAGVSAQALDPICPPRKIPFKGTQEEQWKALLHQIEDGMHAYADARQAGDESREVIVAAQVICLLREARDSHPDPQVKAEFYERERKFAKASPDERFEMMHPFLQGLGILLVSPFLIVGGVLYGVGKLVQGIGSLLTLGAF